MMFRTASIAIFLASASAVTSDLDLCYNNYNEIFPLALGPDACFGQKVFNQVKAKYEENRANGVEGSSKENCRGGPRKEFQKLTGKDTESAAFNYIDTQCNVALAAAADTIPDDHSWGTIEGANVDLADYFAGEGFLNTETGNFQQDVAKFKGGTDKYIEIGTDPTVNDHYPTTKESFAAGEAINEVATKQKTTNFFAQPKGIKDSCTTNAIMCCFHRDRQYFDDNGNCNPTDCANQDPGDNTDLCWTEKDNEVYPYPGGGTEKSIHCHGLAWGKQELGTLDINAHARFNTLFYVSMEDHLRTRGYVESLTTQPNVVVEQPMCGCVEDMAPVARSDCSQATGNANYTVALGDEGIIEITADPDSFELEFEACEGFKFNADVTPDDFATGKSRNKLGLKGRNNDLSAMVFRLYLQGDITEEKMLEYERTVVGLRQPNKTNKDSDRKDVCEEAFHARFGDDVAYEEKVEEVADEERFLRGGRS